MFVSRVSNWLIIFLGILLLVAGSASAILDLTPVNAKQVPDAVEAAVVVSVQPKEEVLLTSRIQETPFLPVEPTLAATPEMPIQPTLTPKEMVVKDGGEEPVRLVIPSINLDAPVIPASTQVIKVAGQSYVQWLAPDLFAAGWHSGSARLGMPGNTVLNGHHNIDGEVFGGLVNVVLGDRILVYSHANVFTYIVANRMILPEKYQELDIRMNNARWILSSDDERLTLITCWPKESNTHRLILVASPVSVEKLDIVSPLD